MTFKEKYPGTISSNGIVDVCVATEFGKEFVDSKLCAKEQCEECWNREIPINQNEYAEDEPIKIEAVILDLQQAAAYGKITQENCDKGVKALEMQIKLIELLRVYMKLLEQLKTTDGDRSSGKVWMLEQTIRDLEELTS